MQSAAEVPAYLYTLAWVGLFVIAIFYVAVGIALRWRWHRSIRVTRYKPPEGISPGLAAALIESGRCERSFAAALVSLAEKGHLEISQKSETITLRKMRDAGPQLPVEESAILSSLFAHVDTCSFNATNSFRLLECYGDFCGVIHSAVISEWMSTHVVIWLVGLIYSLTILEPIVFSTPGIGHGFSLGALIYSGLFVVLGGTTFVAALRVWPALLRKLAAFLPGSRRPKRRISLNDAIPIYLTVTALVGFVFLSVLTSTKLALLAAGALAMNTFSWHLMNAPTAAGRKAVAELASFREFLNRTSADRLDRENRPGGIYRTLEPYSAYAVALGVGTGWGDEFASTILDIIQMDQAYSPSRHIPEPDSPPATLSLFDRKK